MSQDHSYPDCVYFDANIISMIVEHSELYRPLFNFLFENHLCIAVSDALLVKLSQETRKQADFNTFFTLLPSAKIKSFEDVVEEEVKAYPKTCTNTLWLFPANSGFGKEAITSWLIPDEVKKDQRKQLLHAKKMKQCLESVKSHFPPSSLGKYNIAQAEIFAWMVTAQWLRGSHPEFMKKLNNDRRLLKAEAFPSIRLFAYYFYYKYYLGIRQPKASYNLGDVFDLFYLPYCKLIVLEPDMSSILNKIKSHSKMLDDVKVTNKDFFNNSQTLRR
jgi:hypothetical protein